MKVAILIDGEWFRIALSERLGSALKPHGVTAAVVHKTRCSLWKRETQLLGFFITIRCRMWGKREIQLARNLFPALVRRRLMPVIAFFTNLARCRSLRLDVAWSSREDGYYECPTVKEMLKGGKARPLTAGDVTLSMTQKGVDMRIGIDVATLSLKKQVDRIILISGDLDMIPAMKLARREGVQVVMVQFDKRNISTELVEDADFLRTITPTV
jgi:uncharacterized LabA/DUF88 family protein